MKNYFASYSQVVVCLLVLFLFSEFKCTASITEKMIKRAKFGNKACEEGDRFDWDFLAKKLETLKNEVPGVDVNEQNIEDEYFTALHYAAALGGVQISQKHYLLGEQD